MMVVVALLEDAHQACLAGLVTNQWGCPAHCKPTQSHSMSLVGLQSSDDSKTQ